MEDENRIKSGAMAWLYEMEAFDSNVLQVNLQENILLTDNKIKSCELLIIRETKEIMVFIELGRMSEFFYKSNIKNKVSIVIGKLLPSFRCRVVTDKKIFTLAIKQLSDFLKGNDESKTKPIIMDGDGNPIESKAGALEIDVPEESDLLSDKKE